MAVFDVVEQKWSDLINFFSDEVKNSDAGKAVVKEIKQGLDKLSDGYEATKITAGNAAMAVKNTATAIVENGKAALESAELVKKYNQF